MPEATQELYIRTAAAPSGTDPKTYDCGQLIIGVNGSSVTTAIGEAWWEYDVELHTPQATQAAVFSIQATLANGVATAVRGQLDFVASASNQIRVKLFTEYSYICILQTTPATSFTVTSYLNGVSTAVQFFTTAASTDNKITCYSVSNVDTLLVVTNNGYTGRFFVTPMDGALIPAALMDAPLSPFLTSRQNLRLEIPESFCFDNWNSELSNTVENSSSEPPPPPAFPKFW